MQRTTPSRRGAILRDMAHDLIEYLRSRQHKEKPHISVLGFPLRRFLGSLLKQEGLLSRSVRRVSEGEEEEDIAVETDVLYSRPGWWIMGVKVDRVELERADESAEIRIKWSFCIRVAPPRCIRTAPLPMQVQVDHTGCYRRVLVSIRYRPLTEQAYVEILISDPDTGRPCGPLIHQQVSNARRGVVVALPSGAESYKILKHLTDDEWREFRRLEIQSVINELKVRHRVGWTPSRLASSDFVHRFCVTLSVERENKDVYKIETLLMNLGGIFRDPADNGRLIEQPYLYVFDNEGYRWAVGYLMEVEGTVELDGLKAACAWTPCGLMRLTPINSMAEIRDDGHRIEIRDWLIAQEEVMPVKEGSSPYGLLIKLADELWSGNRLARAVAEALSYALGNLGIARLRTFQEESCRKILRRLVAGQHDAAVVITSRTAGGKTLAFFLPSIFYAAIEKGRGRRGVKVLALYPTKALANDQLDELVRLLWYFNNYIEQLGHPEAQLSVGAFHGDVPSRIDINEIRRYFFDEPSRPETTLRIECPVHSTPFKLRWSLRNHFYKEELACSATSNCPAASVISRWLRLTREAVCSDPPDILITNPDMINTILMESADNHALLGRSAKVCPNCGSTYANQRKRLCEICGNSLIPLQDLCGPLIIILDDVHIMRGNFGNQVHFVMKRLEQAIRTYCQLGSDWRPLYILASATLGYVEEFAKEFVGIEEIDRVDAEYERRLSFEGPELRRYYVFIMPKAYALQATAIRSFYRLYEQFRNYYQTPLEQDRLRSLVFVNTLPESNELADALRRHLGGLRIEVGGHSTDFGPGERAKAERRMSRGELHMLVATRTLEVGVDYKLIDVVAIYRMPYYLSDLIQRIGRAGREKDALVLMFFSPDHPTDYFFYRNYKLIIDDELRSEAMMRLEAWIPYTDNEEVIWRSLLRTVFDYLCVSASMGREGRFFKASTSAGFVTALSGSLLQGQAPHQALLNYVSEVSDKMRDLAQRRVSEFVRCLQTIVNFANRHRYTSVSDLSRYGSQLAKDLHLYDLRHSDDMVQLSLPFGVRDRELSVVVRKCSRGQIISYQGKFAVVTSIDSDTVRIDEFLEGGGY